MKKVTAILAVLLFVLSVKASACTGARPLAMGGGFIAIADSADATYWNPAGLATLSASAEGSTSSPIRYLENETRVAKISPKKGIGVFRTYNTIGDWIAVRTEEKWKYPVTMVFPDGTQAPAGYISFEFKNVYRYVSEEEIRGVSYGQRVSKRSSVGVNIKTHTPTAPYQEGKTLEVLRRFEWMKGLVDRYGRLYFYNFQTGVSGELKSVEFFMPKQRATLDLSYRGQITKSLSVGVLLQDVGTLKYNALTSKNLNPRAGVAYQKGRLKAGIDWYGGHKSAPMNNILAGAEYEVNKGLYLRAGTYEGRETLGVGAVTKHGTAVNITRIDQGYIAGISRTF